MDLKQELDQIKLEIKQKEADITAIKKQLRRNPDDIDLSVDLEEKQLQLKDLNHRYDKIVDAGAVVESSKKARVDTGLWLVTGSVADALHTKGVRSRVYRLADLGIGYYDPSHPQAIYYEDKTLMVHILFKSEETALRFDSQLQNEEVTMGSPMNGHEITSQVVLAESASNDSLRRIRFKDYKPMDSESPQESMSQIATEFSYFANTTDEFKYQKIEEYSVFGPLGMAESCHLMSREHCRKYESYRSFDRNPSNRLALSRDMHGFFDGLNTGGLPVVKMSVVSVSPEPVVDGRYEVRIQIKVLTVDYKSNVFNRLKKGSKQVDGDDLAMTTSVLILDPNVFKKCMDWKEKQTQKQWDDYCNMDSAVP
ncbi:hypothetical protein EDD86DRAFT_65890 [Gorgonomyces haynaldii]|nr:hypothetical protein EDD86DRAFT_65890 [Gorgonomyces haynaldii]